MMLNRKLVLRNARRLWKDYLTYFLTLCMIMALMSAFNALLFSKDIDGMIHYGNSGELSTAGTMLVTFMSASTIVIVMIAAWLVNYMTRFILEKRSREFAIYLLSGMKRSQISALYMKENLLLGICALFVGILLGSGLQQILFLIFYRSIGKNYRVHAEVSVGSILLTVGLYGACFLVALCRNRKKFSRMEIIALINMDRQNERVDEGRKFGVSAFFMKYINNKGSLIYKKENLFLLRQFSSKLRNTQITLVTLSLLFLFALVGGSLAFMLSDYQNKQLEVEYPFDIIIISDDAEDDFLEEESLIKENAVVRELLKYSVYHNGTSYVRDFLYQNLKTFSDKDENPTLAEERRDIDYYENDVYMGLADYNRLRGMLRLEPVSLGDNEYLIHMPDRVYGEIKENASLLEDCVDIDLAFAEFYTEGFAQSGHNGADFLLVVPDEKLRGMEKYFSLLAVMTEGETPEYLSELLYGQAGKTRGFDEIADYIRIGSEELFLTPATIQVKSRETLELRFLMSTLSFPLFYIGLVFLCVSFTVLSVQQLSDANKYKFRYQILHRLGMRKGEIRVTVAKQLFFYYLCPVLFALVISAAFILYVGKQFVIHTGIHTAWFLYLGISASGFLGVYALYFALTYVQFLRSIGMSGGLPRIE